MIYAFIDTNVFVRVATQGRPGCEQKHFDDLRTLVKEGEFQLLVPEVVSLEVKKVFRSLPKTIGSKCDKLHSAVTKATQDTWNEIESLKVEVLNRIADFKEAKIEECKNVSSNIVDFLQSESVVRISLSPDILVAAKRRHIAGEMPKCKNSSDQDALIVESLVSFFAGHDDQEASLLFCSENTSNFALAMEPKQLDKRFMLDPQIKAALPPAQYSTDLASMLQILQGFEELPEPTSSEIENAVTMRDLYDSDDEEYWVNHLLLTKAVNEESAKQFEEDFLPSVPENVRAARERLSTKVQDLLTSCRSCSSWEERSEYKLPQWIEFVDESMIPYTSLAKLVRIKNSLEQYLKVHQRMDRDGNVAD